MSNILMRDSIFIIFVIYASSSEVVSRNVSSPHVVEHPQQHSVAPPKSDSDIEFIKVLSSRLFHHKKPLDFTVVPEVSDNCHRDFVHYLSALKTFELWALKMYDANGQISVGVLSGNVNSYGDFQECLSVGDDESLGFRGKHCYAGVQPFVSKSATFLNFLRKLAQSYDLMRSSFTDPAHVFGRFSTITHGICVPSSCSHRDVEIAVKYFLKNFTKNTGLRFDVQVDEQMCQVKETDGRPHLEFGEKLTIGLFVLICVLSFASTVYEEKSFEKNLWLTSFSVKKNWRELTSIKRSKDDIKAVHGIRFINAILIFLCHKTVESLTPRLNRTEMAVDSARPESIIVRMCALYTDVFLMLSGMLVAYSLTKRLKKGQHIKLAQEYIGRYIRIVPSIVVIMLVTMYVNPLLMGQNPQRALVIETPAKLCKDYGWRNLLMIHNWFDSGEMCLLHTHHVGSDFELFLIAPMLLTILWRWPKKGLYFILILASASTCARFYVTYSRELMYYVPFGAKLSNLLATANHLYTLPTHRFTVYGIGLMLGFVLRKYNMFRLSKAQFIVGEIINGAAIVAVISCGTAMTGIDVTYDVMLHSLYAAFAPIIYCLHVGWIILSSHQGHKGAFTRFFEWRGFLITTKFCYAFYLIQIPIFQLSIAKTKDIRFYDATSMINLNEIFVVCVASVLLTLLVETPFNNIKKLMFTTKTTIEEKDLAVFEDEAEEEEDETTERSESIEKKVS